MLEGAALPLYADVIETELQTEESTSETVETAVETETETEAAAETEVLPETDIAAETEEEAETEAPAETETEAVIETQRLKDDAEMKAFWDEDAHRLALLYVPFNTENKYQYTIINAENDNELQSGTLETKSYEKFCSAVIKLDETKITEDVKALKIIVSDGDQEAQVLAAESMQNPEMLTSELTAEGDLLLAWDAAKADGYAVLALSDETVVLYETTELETLELAAPEDAEDVTVMMAAFDEPEKGTEGKLTIFSPVTTVSVDAADAQISETEIETEKELAAETVMETEEVLLNDAAQKATNLKARGYEKSAKLTWTKGTDVTGYRIWVFDTKTGKRILQTYETGTEYKVTNLTPDSDYMFKLRAYKEVDGVKVFGPMSEEVNFSTIHFVPAVAENVKASAGETTAKITWTKGSMAHGYYLSVYDVESGKRVFTTRTTGTSLNVSGLTIGKEYRYVMRGYREVDGVIYYGSYSEKYLFKTHYIVPAKTTGLKAVSGDLSATLNWNKAANATHYYIQVKDPDTGKIAAAGRTRNLKYTVEGLKNNKVYSFRVSSYRLVNNHTTYAKATDWVKVTPKLQAPPAPTSLEIVFKDGSNVLTWSEVKNANGYVVYSYDFDAKKYVKVATVKTNTWTDKGNGETGKYRYLVKAFRRENGKTLYGPGISKLIYGNQDLLEASEIHPILYSGKVNQNTTLYTTQSGSQTAGSVKAGTAVTVSFRTHSGRNRIILSDGSVYWVKPSAVSCYSDHYTTKDYSKTAKETFINKAGYSSNSKYFVWVSTYTQKVNIFTGSKGNWTLLLTTPCATGVVATFTPHGSGILKSHERTHYTESSYYEWLTYFTSGNAFHTRIKKLSDGSFRGKTLGKPMSGGCVRVKDDIARMIYYDMPLKTGELIY